MNNNFRGCFVKDSETSQWYFIPLEQRTRFHELLAAMENAPSSELAEEIFAEFTMAFGAYETLHPVHYTLENLEEIPR